MANVNVLDKGGSSESNGMLLAGTRGHAYWRLE